MKCSRWSAADERKERWSWEFHGMEGAGEMESERRSGDEKHERRRWRRVVKQRMEDLASRVALVGKASPLLPDKRWPWPMMWNGFDWLSLIPQQSEPRSSPGARSTTVTLSDISYFTPTTMTTAALTSSPSCSTFHTSLPQQWNTIIGASSVQPVGQKWSCAGPVPSKLLYLSKENHSIPTR